MAPITSSRFSAFIAFAFYTGEQQQEEKESRLQFIWMLVKTWSMKLYSFLSKKPVNFSNLLSDNPQCLHFIFSPSGFIIFIKEKNFAQ